MEASFLAAFDAWADAVVTHTRAKGPVPPGRWRAFGYEAPSHRLADLRLAWRDRRMRAGHAPDGSSPALQDAQGLNRDAHWNVRQGEGERLRE
jgi:hypothetical protein